MKVKLLQKECMDKVVNLPDHHALLLIKQGKAAFVAEIISGPTEMKTEGSDEIEPLPIVLPKAKKRKGKKKC